MCFIIDKILDLSRVLDKSDPTQVLLSQYIDDAVCRELKPAIKCVELD